MEAPACDAVLWQPDPAFAATTRITAYMQWLARAHGLTFVDYQALWQWSVDDLDGFWRSVLEHFDVQAEGSAEVVLASRAMPGAQWFPGLRLNYAEQVFRASGTASPAIVARREGEPDAVVEWADLQLRTAAVARTLRDAGVQAGDRVACCLPNWLETVVAFLATASLGAIWSSCAPDMGVDVIADRFCQIAPKVLIATESYRYNGRVHDRSTQVEALLARLPSVELVLHVPGPLHMSQGGGAVAQWRHAMHWSVASTPNASSERLDFVRVAFDHPLWIVYSSGTTGLPKALVHSHGGITLTHLKTMALQHDLRAGDRMLFLGSPGWIVWNLLVGGLLTGATIVLLDGHPDEGGKLGLWLLLERWQVTHFGCGAAYLTASMKAGVRPADEVPLKRLRAIVSTGSPLPDEAYRWVYDAVKRDVWLASVSGGTDIASGFVACCALLPVRAGEIQCRELGVAAYAFDEQGVAVVEEVGELVVTQPMPSMPVRFWGDADGTRYHESYFDAYPGVWRHGDWVRFTARGSAVIYGRSDATINRHGIRMGTADIYRAVEDLDEIADSLVVDLEFLGRPSFMPLFVVLAPGATLTDALRERILSGIRTRASARHVPDAVVQISEVPRTLTGKKMEVPVRKLLLGQPLAQVVKAGALVNPDALAFFVRYAVSLSKED